MYAPACSIQRLAELLALRGVTLVVYARQCLAGGGRRVACGIWQVAGSVFWPKL